MKENQFQKKVKKQLEDQGAFIINLHGHMMQRSGLPDLQILHMKWDGFLELKVDKNKASALQRIVAAKIESRGTPIYVLRCVERDKHDMILDFKIKYIYTIENFEGDIIKTFYDLRELLSILVELSKPNPYCEYLNNKDELPTGDSKTCKEQCIPYTRDICRKEWEKNDEFKEKN